MKFWNWIKSLFVKPEPAPEEWYDEEAAERARRAEAHEALSLAVAKESLRTGKPVLGVIDEQGNTSITPLPLPDPPPAPEPELIAERWAVGKDGWLIGDPYRKVQTHSSRRPRSFVGPLAIIWHNTSTKGGAKGMADRRVPPHDSTKEKKNTSWHFTVDRDGTLWQLVPVNKGAYHCADGKVGGKKPNNCTIGVELVGTGESFTEAQYKTCRALIRTLGITAHYGHSVLSDDGKTDPGAVFERAFREFPEVQKHFIFMDQVEAEAKRRKN